MTTHNPTFDMRRLLNVIASAETEASRGCGLVAELYEARVQSSYASILAKAQPEDRAATEFELKARGFNPDFAPRQPSAGECSLTGIDTNNCPCGRHE